MVIRNDIARNVLVVTKGHPFDRGAFFAMLDALPGQGEHYTWTHVEHPAAAALFRPDEAWRFSAFLLYDMPGIGFRVPQPPAGSIINVSSIAGLAGMASNAAYTASKGGVRLLTKSVAVHCARSGLAIRCNSIHPGAIDTPMLSPALDGAPDRGAVLSFLNNLSPMGHMGTGDDIAAMAAFLASDESAYVTGAEMLVDGGMMAQVQGM
jgi:NAD(P)-dependent dehydrogenase (short-subunit alcohol dehydrogenase family)